MSLAVIQPIDMTMRRIWVPVVSCARCKQRMPADHRHHITSEAAPEPPGTASNPPTEGDHS